MRRRPGGPTAPAHYLGADLLAPADPDPANAYAAARPEWSFRALYVFTHFFSGALQFIPIFVVPVAGHAVRPGDAADRGPLPSRTCRECGRDAVLDLGPGVPLVQVLPGRFAGGRLPGGGGAGRAVRPPRDPIGRGPGDSADRRIDAAAERSADPGAEAVRPAMRGLPRLHPRGRQAVETGRAVRARDVSICRAEVDRGAARRRADQERKVLRQHAVCRERDGEVRREPQAGRRAAGGDRRGALGRGRPEGPGGCGRRRREVDRPRPPADRQRGLHPLPPVPRPGRGRATPRT